MMLQFDRMDLIFVEFSHKRGRDWKLVLIYLAKVWTFFDKIFINLLLGWRFSNALLLELLNQVVGFYDLSVYIRLTALDLE